MASEIAQRFYDLLRKHFETGVPWQNMAFTDEQKKRVEVCLDAYKRFEEDPFMNLRQYIINRWKRTYSQLGGDLKVIDFISSFYAKGQRNISSMKVRAPRRRPDDAQRSRYGQHESGVQRSKTAHQD